MVFNTFYEGEDKAFGVVSFTDSVEQAYARTAGEARATVERVASAIGTALGSDDPTVISSRDSALGRLPKAGNLWDQPVAPALGDFLNAINQWRGQQDARKAYAQQELDSLSKTYGIESR